MPNYVESPLEGFQHEFGYYRNTVLTLIFTYF